MVKKAGKKPTKTRRKKTATRKGANRENEKDSRKEKAFIKEE